MFPDYTPLTIVPDHSLPSELPMGTFSPNSLLMYEQPCDLFGVQGSGACSGINMATFASVGDTFDLNPVLEQSNDLSFVDDDIGASSWSAKADLVKAEDAFVDKKGIMQGPTLAALNDDPSVPSVSAMPWIDDIETLIKSDMSYMSSDCHMTQNAYLNDQCEREAITATAAFFKPPQPKPPTCTVTNMSPSAFPTPDNHLPVPPTQPGSLAKSFPTARTLKPSATVTCDNSNFDSKSSLTQLLSVKKERDETLPIVMPAQLATQCPLLQRWGVKRSLLPSGDSSHSMDMKWEEIKQFIHDENEQQRVAMMRQISAMQKGVAEASPVKQIKTEQPDVSVPVKEDPEFQQDHYMSDTDDSNDDDFSDTESLASQSSYVDDLLVGGAQNKKRYFWQYNTQSKGPKGKRLCKSVEVHDPHVLNNFEDPVFDPELNHMRYKHNGKARRGDGNDVTPNPVKLFKIGNELCRLNNAITDMTPPVELPQTVKSKSRREKNKFASRACRLKKKAQHEANKVKLYGLQKEHNQLMKVLESIKIEIVAGVGCEKTDRDCSFTDRLQVLIDKHLRSMVAGYTTEYVNSVLEHITNGDPTGGLDLE